MYDHRKLSEDHSILTDIATMLAGLLRAAQPDTTAINVLRWRMSRILLLHLAQEDNLLYPALKRSRDPEIRDIAARFQSEMGALAETYRVYMLRWDGRSIVADWNGFRAESRAIIAALHRRIRREETELYPRLRDAA